MLNNAVVSVVVAVLCVRYLQRGTENSRNGKCKKILAKFAVKAIQLMSCGWPTFLAYACQ